MASGYEMRVSDAEREAAATELREHFASGRLNQEELDERLGAAFTAKTRGDLNALFTDLPSSGHGWAGEGGPGGPGDARPGDGGPWSNAGAWTGWSSREPGNNAWRSEARHAIGTLALSSVLLWALLILGLLGVFGIGTGRPIGVVLIIAAFALLRRLLFVIFGRRRAGGRGCGPRGRRRL